MKATPPAEAAKVARASGDGTGGLGPDVSSAALSPHETGRRARRYFMFAWTVRTMPTIIEPAITISAMPTSVSTKCTLRPAGRGHGRARER